MGYASSLAGSVRYCRSRRAGTLSGSCLPFALVASSVCGNLVPCIPWTHHLDLPMMTFYSCEPTFSRSVEMTMPTQAESLEHLSLLLLDVGEFLVVPLAFHLMLEIQRGSRWNI